MALTSWKSFNFFAASSVTSPDDPESSPLRGVDIASLTTTSDNLFIGSADGFVHVVSSAFKIVRTFDTRSSRDFDHATSSNGSVNWLKLAIEQPYLLAITEDLSSEPVLKVWDLSKPDKKTNGVKCQSTLTVNNGRRQFPISAFAATPGLAMVAVGFANGSVTLIRGDLIHDRGTRQRIIFESEEPITNLAFSPPSGSLKEEGGETLYVATTTRVLTIAIGRSVGQPNVLENQGCGVACMIPVVDGHGSTQSNSMREGGDIVVAREDALYFYGPNGRGACYSYEGSKQMIKVFKNYIALVSPPPPSHPSAVTSGLKRHIGRANEPEDTFDTTKFTLLNFDLKFIAHTEHLVSSVKEVFSSWGDLFVLTTEGKLWRYHEVSLQEKLDLLYSRNLYVLAMTLGQDAAVSEMKLCGIYRRYADYLYGKGDYDSSMQWYIKALGSAKEQGISTVIRKFLDTQRIQNLTEYLEELHKHEAATSDHTTLLLNCYAKLKDVAKLESFIEQSGEPLNFDVDTAIGMCRQASYFDQAVYLARQQKEHDIVISILLEDLEKVDVALDYIRRQDPDVVYHNLMKYARVLLQKFSKETTELFVEYYNGRYVPWKEDLRSASSLTPEPQEGGRIQAYLNTSLLQQLPYMGGTSTPASQQSQSTAIRTEEEDAPPLAVDVKPYVPPKPRTAFSSFVEHPSEFVLFLERILGLDDSGEPTSDLTKEDKIDIFTTLFEMYLQRSNESKDRHDRKQWESKARRIIEHKDKLIDTSNILLLSHLADFHAGITTVREQQGLRFDIFRSCCSAGDTAGAIRALRKYGSEEPQLYPAALSYFTSSPQVLKEAGDELGRVLQIIDEQGLMKPLQVVQTLSAKNVATIGMVKKYLGDTIERERREIQNNRELIAQYTTETREKSQKISALSTGPSVFQAQRCNACGSNLDLPAVHFLCKHSFHQRCLNSSGSNSAGGAGDAELECVKCASENQIVRTLKRTQDEMADRHEFFKMVLNESRHKFGTVADFFGKGVMVAGFVS